jgi:hypothetical protein
MRAVPRISRKNANEGVATGSAPRVASSGRPITSDRSPDTVSRLEKTTRAVAKRKNGKEANKALLTALICLQICGDFDSAALLIRGIGVSECK